MELRFNDGQVLQVSFLPGHHSLHYEFAVSGGLYAVSRSRFIAALKAAGVDGQRIPTN
jgi:hypothetical protein